MINEFCITILQFLLPKYFLTKIANILANCEVIWIKNLLIKYFLNKYPVDLNAAANRSIASYKCFNDFFIRKLRPECRPISTNGIVAPVDGTISQCSVITNNKFLQAKNHTYTINELLACSALSFTNGIFATFYLAPKDYHRIHAPIDATVRRMIYIPGKLFSVQPATTKLLPKLFSENRRVVIFFDTPVGLMAMVLVGAVIVGSIATAWHGEFADHKEIMHYDYTNHTPKITLKTGEELGYFKLGSTVILLFANQQNINWLSNIKNNHNIQYGQAIATILNQ